MPAWCTAAGSGPACSLSRCWSEEGPGTGSQTGPRGGSQGEAPWLSGVGGPCLPVPSHVPGCPSHSTARPFDETVKDQAGHHDGEGSRGQDDRHTKCI